MSEQMLMRPKAPQSSDLNLARRLNKLWKYIDATGLQKSMEDLCAQLLNRAELPCNPYLGFVHRLHQQAERFRLNNTLPIERILSDLNFPTFSTAIGYISGSRNSTHVWGLPSLLRCVSPAHIKQYSWLVDDVTPPLATLHHTSTCTVQVLCALTGSSIFTGTFYDLPPSVDILIIFVVIGPSYQKAISLYAECLRNDIIRMVQEQKHVVFRLIVPIDKNGQSKDFSKDELLNHNETFYTSVLAAVSEKQLIRLECLWQLNATGDDFHRGLKLYGLSVVQSSEVLGNERSFDFSEQPLIHMYTSVFLQRTHAEAYHGLFVLREQATDKDLQQPQTKASYKTPGDERAKPALNRISTPSKVPLHGFQYTHESDSSSILEPIRKSMMQRIASTPMITGAFDIAHLSILIILMELGNVGNQEHGPQMTDKDQGLQEALIQLDRFLHGSASQMWTILNLIQTICILLESDNVEVKRGKIYSSLAGKIRKLLLDFLRFDYRSVSSNFKILSKALKKGLESALDSLSETPHSKLLDSFKMVLWYGMVSLIQSVEDSLPWVPVLTDMKRQADTTFPTTSPENNQVTGNSKYSPHDTAGLLYNKDCYINVSESASNVKAPGLSHLDAVLTKYCVDCRLDWHWEQCLQGILSESTLPPNPYPVVASEFIKASLRMDLWQKKDEEIIHQTLQLTSKFIDCGNYIFQVPGLEVFGLKSALCPLNPITFETVLGLITLMGNKDIPHQYQSFKVAASLGVNSSATWFGSLSPFLDILELTEFYYLKGPTGCDREALQACAKIVQSHLEELQQQLKGALTFTMWLSESQSWSASDILTYPSAFIEAFVGSAENGRPTYLKVLLSTAGLSWCYLPIVKYFVLYYFEDQEESWRSYPQHEPVAIYQNVFLSRDAAAFHCQRVGPVGDPFNTTNQQEVMAGLEPQIHMSFVKEDLLMTYRLAAVKGLIAQRLDTIPACWRMMHSVAAQLQHLNRLNETIQELLSLEARNGIKSRKVSADMLNSSQPNLSEEALLRYQTLLQVTLKSQSCPAPHNLSEIALTRIRMVNVRNSVSGCNLLKEVAMMCQAVSDIVMWELHALCPEMEQLLRSLDKQAWTLSVPVTSPAPLRSGIAHGSATPETWASNESATGAITNKKALEGW
ncbi:uncharacterized protein LOC122552236 [Chiloscyllium plagiosum]|uniref:uncharacterized protein LOC122552236 n=1 Tax=Chiloscyllium plagiosum TaxID=36176 RepID=UPI001CB86BC1|nr:uncharacterized protein LOC122552236 [Chiloscyllium plagiosum]